MNPADKQLLSPFGDARGSCNPASASSASFTITAKGPGLHRQFKGTAKIKSGQASAATILFAMLNHIITQDGLSGDTSITARMTLKQAITAVGHAGREARVTWLVNNWNGVKNATPRAVALLMLRAGLYSPNTGISDIARSLEIGNRYGPSLMERARSRMLRNPDYVPGNTERHAPREGRGMK